MEEIVSEKENAKLNVVGKCYEWQSVFYSARITYIFIAISIEREQRIKVD